MICFPPKKAARMQSWKRFRKFRCLNCIRSRGHPFKVKDDEAMMETADSIKQYGVLVPAIARPDPDGGYELVAGHRRHRASELAEKETMPVIVRDLDDDAATIIMVDSNLQRESSAPQ